jgi:hypothetical protein
VTVALVSTLHPLLVFFTGSGLAGVWVISGYRTVRRGRAAWNAATQVG